MRRHPEADQFAARPLQLGVGGVELKPLVQWVDDMLAAIDAQDWPALALPLIEWTPSPL